MRAVSPEPAHRTPSSLPLSPLTTYANRLPSRDQRAPDAFTESSRSGRWFLPSVSMVHSLLRTLSVMMSIELRA